MTEKYEFTLDSVIIHPDRALARIKELEAAMPLAALEKRDVDEKDVTGWGVIEGHAIPVAVARKIATCINICIRSAQTQDATEVVTADHQLVPKKATDFMIAAAIMCDWRRGDDTIRNIWRAMLTAAPAAKQEGQ